MYGVNKIVWEAPKGIFTPLGKVSHQFRISSTLHPFIVNEHDVCCSDGNSRGHNTIVIAKWPQKRMSEVKTIATKNSVIDDCLRCFRVPKTIPVVRNIIL